MPPKMPAVLEKPAPKNRTNNLKRHGVKRAEQLQEKLAVYSRQPFMEVLAVFLQSAPDVESIMRFAKEKPDKWAAAVSAFARMAGYTEKTEVQHNVQVEITHMSDAQLIDAIQELQASIKDASLPSPRATS